MGQLKNHKLQRNIFSMLFIHLLSHKIIRSVPPHTGRRKFKIKPCWDVTIASQLRSIVWQRLVNPWQQVFHLSIDPKLLWSSTSIAPTGGAMQIKLPTSLTHHRSTTIPLTGVNSTLLQACADHGVMDLSRVSFITASAIDYRNLSLLKNVWSHSTGSKSAPARDPAFGTVSWFGDGMGKTHQIYVPNKRK